MLLSTQGPFPPPALPGFSGTTNPSATLQARPAPRGVPVDVCRISPQGFPCCCLLPLPCVPASLPRRKRIGARVALFPIRQRPSPKVRRVGFRIVRFEACSTFTRVPARMVAGPPMAAFDTRVLQTISFASMIRPGCYQPERQLLGGVLHPPEKGAFPRRTGPSWITPFLLFQANPPQPLDADGSRWIAGCHPDLC